VKPPKTIYTKIEEKHNGDRSLTSIVRGRIFVQHRPIHSWKIELLIAVVALVLVMAASYFYMWLCGDL